MTVDTFVQDVVDNVRVWRRRGYADVPVTLPTPEPGTGAGLGRTPLGTGPLGR